MAVQTTNPYLEGAYAPVEQEVTATDLDVVGTLPPELDGRYVRNGPNPLRQNVPDPATHHWFVGDGMVHGIRLRDGRAEWYRNRWVRSTKVSEALGEPPAPGERHADMDTVNTHVIGHAGRTLALVEAGARPVELTDELETVCHTDLDGTLPNGFSAHPKRDPESDELFVTAYHWGLPHLQYIVVGTDGRVRKVEPIPVDDGPMVHDTSITERFAVVYDMPITFSLDLAVQGLFPYAWNDDHPARLGVLPREGTAADLRWFDVDPCYVFHPLNAHEEGTDDGQGRIVLHVVRHDRTFVADHQGPAAEGRTPPTLWRWTLDLDTGRTTEEQLDDRAQEFPRVAESRVGREARYGWSVEMGAGPVALAPSSRILRRDLATGEVAIHDAGEGRQVGEAVAIPRDGGDPERDDDAWLMALAHDRDTDRGELVVWAADDPGAEPVARVPLPARVPHGFHGSWIATT